MAESSLAPKRRPRVQKSCTECQRRKQKVRVGYHCRAGAEFRWGDRRSGLVARDTQTTEKLTAWWQCIIRNDGVPCANCSRRFPPVECTVLRVDAPDGETRAPEYEEQVVSLGVPVSIVSSAGGRHVNYVPAGTSVIRTRRVTPMAKARARIIAWPDSTDGSTDDACDETAFIGRSSEQHSENLYLDGTGDPDAMVHIRPFGGILTEVCTLNGLRIKQSARNSELLHFYVQIVAPNLVSIDGQSQPKVFLTEVLPWMLQSPLFPSIGMLMASTTQSLEKGVEVTRNSESLAIKARVLTGINEMLKRDFGSVAQEVIRSVINLCVMEWFWGADDSMWAHLRGMKHMINLRSGLRGIKDIVGEDRTDYEISCCFETELYLQSNDPVLQEEIPIPTSWPDGFDCPLIRSSVSFDDVKDKLRLTGAGARILDDVRFLTTSITEADGGPASIRKIQSTASWIYSRLSKVSGREGGQSEKEAEVADVHELGSEAEHIEEALRLAGLIYSWSISSMAQISQFKDGKTLEQAYKAIRGVNLTRWKSIPGIFLWIMLVAAPSTKQDTRGRFIRRKMAVAGLSIGFESFGVGISYLRAFWLVQRWIARQGKPAADSLT
ncbi:hypothetical protein BN1708_013936 [Verticillium longisporum]|uniref:Uncharacterized protein n=1 Tax=Verticillium longisporum TaxID=100787 RepID=A0A0G4LQS3_VERLO|nr:hypothetical protein BN1708_013936 [Verticillium longisporum]